MASPVKGTKRKAKDTGKPKKPTTSYFYFLEECRRKAKEEGRSLSKIAEFTKECSAQWKAITEKEKKKFEDKAAADRKRYNKDMESYVPTEEDEAVKKSKKVKDENKPKRPQTAYFLFLADYRKKMKGMENRELIKTAGVEWKKLTVEEKKPYEKGSEAEKKKYDIAIAAYNKGIKPGTATAKKSQPAANGTDEDDDDDEEEEDDDEEDDDDDEEDDE